MVSPFRLPNLVSHAILGDQCQAGFSESSPGRPSGDRELHCVCGGVT